jgi:hypothetical protein
MIPVDNKQEPRDGVLIAISRRQAVAMAEQLKCEGKIAAITEKAGGVFTVRWIDWQPPRGPWRDGRDARLFIKP